MAVEQFTAFPKCWYGLPGHGLPVLFWRRAKAESALHSPRRVPFLYQSPFPIASVKITSHSLRPVGEL